jgi:hypothetical protein
MTNINYLSLDIFQRLQRRRTFKRCQRLIDIGIAARAESCCESIAEHEARPFRVARQNGGASST